MSKEPEIPEELAALSPRRRAFVVAYTGEHLGIAAGAYRAAGFRCQTEGALHACASRLLADNRIRAAVDAIMETAPGLATAPEVAAFWTATMRDESLRIRDRLRASELLARAHGMFNRKREPVGYGGGPVIVEVPPKLSHVEWMQMVAEGEAARLCHENP